MGGGFRTKVGTGMGADVGIGPEACGGVRVGGSGVGIDGIDSTRGVVRGDTSAKAAGDTSAKAEGGSVGGNNATLVGGTLGDRLGWRRA